MLVAVASKEIENHKTFIENKVQNENKAEELAKMEAALK